MQPQPLLKRTDEIKILGGAGPRRNPFAVGSTRNLEPQIHRPGESVKENYRKLQES